MSSKILFAAALACVCHAQPKFEVASIKPADPNSRGMGFQRMPGGGLRGNGVTAAILIKSAYGIQDFQLVGAPSWVSNERYNIEAKPDQIDEGDNSGPATKDQWAIFRERLKGLLAERFQLKVRTESKEANVYVLVVEKGGHKMKAATLSNGIRRQNRGELLGMGADMELFSNLLSSMVGKPVLDQTGLTGKFEFKITYSEEGVNTGDKPGGAAPAPDETSPSIFTALQQQLGLRLQSQKGPVPSIVIERIEKPSEN
jgi:bla regulator protein blaR1